MKDFIQTAPLYKITLASVLIATICTILANPERARLIYNYKINYSELTKNHCTKFAEEYNSRLSSEAKSIEGNFKSNDFMLKNKKILDWFDPNDSRFAIGDNELLMKFCITWHQANYMMYRTQYDYKHDPFSRGKPPITEEMNIFLANIAASIAGLFIFIKLLKSIKSKNEGAYRFALIFGAMISAIPYITSTATPLAFASTQSFTFPTILIVLIYTTYKLFKWILDGFKKQ